MYPLNVQPDHLTLVDMVLTYIRDYVSSGIGNEHNCVSVVLWLTT